MSRLIRVLAEAESVDQFCYGEGCVAAPNFSVATPHGPFPACDDHADELLASLPEEFLRQWEEPLAGVGDEVNGDGIPL